jgi:hypothetical protein
MTRHLRQSGRALARLFALEVTRVDDESRGGGPVAQQSEASPPGGEALCTGYALASSHDSGGRAVLGGAVPPPAPGERARPSAVWVHLDFVFATGDGAHTDNWRDFGEFIFSSFESSPGVFTPLVAFTPSHPECPSPSPTCLVVSADITPVTAQSFRAIFTTFFGGPRVQLADPGELTDPGETLPAPVDSPASVSTNVLVTQPATLSLLGTGMLLVLAMLWRRLAV